MKSEYLVQRISSWIVLCSQGISDILSIPKNILTGFFMLSVVTGWVRVGLWDCQPPSVCGVGVGQSFTNHCPSSCPLFFFDSLVILLTVPIFIWKSQEPQFFNLDTFHGNSSTPSTQIIKIPHNFQPCNVSCVTSIIWLSVITIYFFVSSENNNSPWLSPGRYVLNINLFME